MALGERSVRAKSYSGNQVGILTDSAHNKARIQDIQLDTLKSELDAGGVPVVAGFQGVDVDGNVTTLGRASTACADRYEAATRGFCCRGGCGSARGRTERRKCERKRQRFLWKLRATCLLRVPLVRTGRAGF